RRRTARPSPRVPSRFLLLPPRPPPPTLFPYTTLFRSAPRDRVSFFKSTREGGQHLRAIGAGVARFLHTEEVTGSIPVSPTQDPPDRKSTRLNSSHVSISYAVFCLKKKKLRHKQQLRRK